MFVLTIFKYMGLTAYYILMLPFWVGRQILHASRVQSAVQAAYRKWRGKKPGTHGNAELADLKKLRELGHLEQKGWLVGIKAGVRTYLDEEACGIGMAPRRSGKSLTASAQLLDLCRRLKKPDVIVYDPSGDLRANTEAAYRAAGYKVINLDFKHPEESDTYNPSLFVRNHSVDNAYRDIQNLGMLIMPPDVKTRESHFLNFARLLFNGILSHRLNQDGQSTTIYEAISNLIVDAKRRDATFNAMKLSGHDQQAIAATAYGEAGDKERGSFGTTLANMLSGFTDPRVRKVFSADSPWTWADIYFGDNPTVTYIATGITNNEGDVARLILGNAINTRAYLFDDLSHAARKKGTRPRFPRELRILVDEASMIGNCRAIADAIARQGKAGVSVMLWFLSNREVYETYPDAKNIINSCNTLVFGGGSEMDFYEDISRQIGERTIESRGRSESDHGTSESANEQAQRVRKAFELAHMPKEDMVAIMGPIAAELKKPYQRISDTEIRFL